MKTYTIILGWIFLTLTISCKETQLTNPNPNPEEEINIEDYLYDYNYERQQCSQRLGNPANTLPHGFSINAINNNKTIIFIRSQTSYPILVIENGITRLESFNTTAIQKKDTSIELIKTVHFSPYDNNLALTLVTFSVKIGSTTLYFDEWYYYHFGTKIFTPMNLEDPKFESIKGKNEILRWVNSSTHGNDKFFLHNNTIISFPSGNIHFDPSGITLRPEEVVHSISPDLKKVFTKYQNELYLNGNKVDKSQFLFIDFYQLIGQTILNTFWGLVWRQIRVHS